MRKQATAAIVASVVGLTLAGCGTVQNLTGGPSGTDPARPYGGVATDVKLAATCLTDSSGGHGGLAGRIAQVCVVVSYLLLIDLPLSYVGDSITLPFTYGYCPTPAVPNQLPSLSVHASGSDGKTASASDWLAPDLASPIAYSDGGPLIRH
jgi:uncharacterized protein YceK